MPNDGDAERRRCRTTEMPNDGNAERRETAAGPSERSEGPRRSCRCHSERSEGPTVRGEISTGTVGPSVATLPRDDRSIRSKASRRSGRPHRCRRWHLRRFDAVWHLRSLASPPFGISAVWHLRRLASPPFGISVVRRFPPQVIPPFDSADRSTSIAPLVRFSEFSSRIFGTPCLLDRTRRVD